MAMWTDGVAESSSDPSASGASITWSSANARNNPDLNTRTVTVDRFGSRARGCASQGSAAAPSARPGPSQTWAAVGIQGLAPYWFEVEATAYVGAAGRTHLRLETEYELLVTNRLVLQPILELEAYGKADPERGIGAGLSSTDAGLRLRYEFRREFAPYVGVTWNRTYFGTAEFAEAEGEKTGGAKLTLGMRVWF